MSDFIDLIKTVFELRKFALNKRFLPFSAITAICVMLWFSGIIAIAIASAWVWVTLILISVFFLLRASIVLIHERKWLCKCAKLIESCDYSAAEVCLNNAPSMLGTPGQLQWLMKKIQLYAATGDLVKEYGVVQQLKKIALFPHEQHKSRLCEASIFSRSGNFKRFGEILDKVNKKALLDSKIKAQYHFLSSCKHEIAGDYAAAKAEIECLLEEDGSGSHNVSAYNNLARLEEIQGNKLQAIHYYEKARDLLRQKPVANLFPIVYHNLVMNLARTGKVTAANAMLEEYGAAIDTRVTSQYLEYLNTQIHLARQLKELPMLLLAYALVDLRIKPKLSQDEWTAQFVSELRTRANDQIGLNEHLIKIELLFTDLMHLPFPKNYYFLKELFGVLRQMVNDNQLGPMKSLFERTISVLSVMNLKIDIFRKTIPDVLLEPHFYWIAEKIALHKLTPASHTEYDQAFFDTLFGQLEELIRIAVDKDSYRLQMRALIMLCDEYSAYSTNMNFQFDPKYRLLAKRSLHEASQLLHSRCTDPMLFEYMVGLAWYEWKINNSAERASHWANLFDAQKINLLHQAIWFRQQYIEVKDWLSKQ